MTWMWLMAAVVAGWMVQLYLTYQQSMSFNRLVAGLRRQGTVSVGVAGKRYRGGRAYVALAIDEEGTVRDAVGLSGWSTFSRGRRLPALVGVRTSRILRPTQLDGLTTQQHDAARQAVELARTHVAV